ncbi:hypothetical protein [Sandarakinorhabdus sp.]|uniref:hypothetical protein n=1 Tax=Sandarakinorhabdus sp. TaxID=1916663 RepID=UPI00286E1BD1|nr:hypothetical protein [Sandarakinorhabdus sp.]
MILFSFIGGLARGGCLGMSAVVAFGLLLAFLGYAMDNPWQAAGMIVAGIAVLVIGIVILNGIIDDEVAEDRANARSDDCVDDELDMDDCGGVVDREYRQMMREADDIINSSEFDFEKPGRWRNKDRPLVRRRPKKPPRDL